ncbi:MAG TPA: [protein-PII] uridylyltransferase [Xanthomonadaceae bacterium]|nr:[protein-PII] uridylyltransferase [Xanthomonadaceae bacterium]
MNAALLLEDWLDEVVADDIALDAAACRECLAEGDARLHAAFDHDVPVDGLVRQRARLVDRVLCALWRGFEDIAGAVALIATGGYGRGELHPHSDIDLMLLVAQAPTGAAAAVLGRFQAALWDTGLRFGVTVRTPAQCREAAAADVGVATALMEARLLTGPAELFDAMRGVVAPPELWPSADYFRAKVAEQQARHARFHDTAYNLEPNLKEGPGGLRDLQTLVWVALRHYGPGSIDALVERGLLGSDEGRTLIRCRSELWRIRWALHRLAGRAEERLLFDHQRALAAAFGLKDEHAQNLAVEQFMQRYYRAAMTMERLNERLLQRFEEAILYADEPESAQPINADFEARRGFVEARDGELFQRRPQALIEVFLLLAERTELRGVRSTTARLIGEALPRIDDAMRADAEANALFMRLLRSEGRVFEALSRMNRYGVFGRFLPAFGKVVGRMQYDLFHVYTVDQHTLFVLRNLLRFREAEAARTHPLAHAVQQRLRKPELLLLAGLFHDIAKGRGGDHSELGADDAAAFCARVGLSAADTDLVVWLVRQHLLMSVTAQRHDITDPEVVNRFATEVAERERLDHLYLLTIADISATSPKLWNNWKDHLLASLYESTRFALRRGLGHPLHPAERIAEHQREARELLRSEGLDEATIDAVWADFPEDSFLRYSPDQLAWQTRALAGQPREALPLVLVRLNERRGTTEVFVCSPDKDGLFATVTAMLDRLGLNVLEARIVNSAGGLALDTFQVLDRDGRAVTSPRRNAEIGSAIARALAHDPLRPELVRRALSRRQRHFQIPVQVEFNQRDGRSEMLLVCSDRAGLLAVVAQALRQCGVRVHDARIATFGERAEDFFMLTDEADRPLDEAAQAVLRETLVANIGEQWEASRLH